MVGLRTDALVQLERGAAGASLWNAILRAQRHAVSPGLAMRRLLDWTTRAARSARGIIAPCPSTSTHFGATQ
jgi:hypothetical protein